MKHDGQTLGILSRSDPLPLAVEFMPAINIRTAYSTENIAVSVKLTFLIN